MLLRTKTDELEQFSKINLHNNKYTLITHHLLLCWPEGFRCDELTFGG